MPDENEDVLHREWGCDSTVIDILTRNKDEPHQEWGLDSPRMHILTGDAHSLYRVFKNKILVSKNNGKR